MFHPLFIMPTKVLVILGLLFPLIACQGGGESTAFTEGATTEGATTMKVSTIGGSVGDGPIIGATLNVYAKDGTLIYSEVSDSQARYNTQISASNKQYPLMIEVTGGVDLVTQRAPDFTLSSVVMKQSADQVININPYTTLVVEMARKMPGGFNKSNLVMAKKTVYRELNFGLDLEQVPDPMTSSVTDDNVAVIVKASEALGEMIRRTHHRIGMLGGSTEIQDTIIMLAADLTDSTLDGSAAENGRIATVISVSVAEIALESMRNELRVDGINVTAALDDAILYVHPATEISRLTGSVRINQEIIDQGKMAVNRLVAAAYDLNGLATELEKIQAGSLALDVAALMIDSSALELTTNLLLTAVEPEVIVQPASDPEPVITSEPAASEPVAVEAPVVVYQPVTVSAPVKVSAPVVVNVPVVEESIIIESIVEPVMEVVTQQPVVEEPIPVTNAAPTLSGSPSLKVTAGSAYNFLPTAVDPDNDSLFFTMSNRPVWLSFNSSTGRVFGTPNDSQVGVFEGISITVSDGAGSATIGPFRIQVTAATPESVAEEVPQDSLRKFNPGHYFSMNRYDSQADMIGALKPGVAGIQKRYYWKQLETGLGVYDFSLVLADLDALAAQGSHLVVFIEDKTFNGELPTPDYLQTNFTLKNRNRGYTAMRWDPYVITRFKALIAAMGKALDKHPALEGIAIQESSLSLDNSILNAHGYTPEKYRDGLIDVLNSAAAEFPSSQVFWYMNFFPQHQSYLRNVAFAVAPAGVTVGGPDVLPGEFSLETHCYPMYDDFKGKMKLFNSMQYNSYDHPHEGTEYATKYWTMGEMFRFAKERLHIQYLFWNRKVAKGTSVGSYNWLDALPVIANNAIINP